MCGIVGFWNFANTDNKLVLENLALKMAEQIAYRGPDSTGAWADEEHGIAFGHRRLAIVDLSPDGHQPMISASGRYIISYNGEVYNFKELRKELEAKGIKFKSNCDTEVIIEAIEEWGIKQACQKFIGMFAFSVWDNKEKCLYLVRDRMGIKPLYYGTINDMLFFGSELKPFREHAKWRPEINHDALQEYFRFNYIPTPLSIYKGIKKVVPGTIIKISDAHKIMVEPFWSLYEVVENNHNKMSEQDALEQLEALLTDAVGRRMIADVPLGAFLSGGVDSSLVVALMQKQSTVPIKTFSIGFHEKDYNEAHYAKNVAKHLGADHQELYLHVNDAAKVIPNLRHMYDEPFADSSQIPTFLVSQLACKHVKVALSGDGGDELFAGYNRYTFADQYWNKLSKIPRPLRKLAGSALMALPPSSWDRLLSKYNNAGDKIHKLAGAMASHSGMNFYQSVNSYWQNPHELVLNSKQKAYPISDMPEGLNLIEQMQYQDSLQYLPDDILTKVDRASMSVSLEARVPLIDHRVVEMSWQLPQSMKIRNGQSKWALREILYKHVPKELIERPKMGFGVPIGNWMRGSIKEWMLDTLSKDNIIKDGLLNYAPIEEKINEHMSGKRNWQNQLWGLLMFQDWYNKHSD